MSQATAWQKHPEQHIQLRPFDASRLVFSLRILVPIFAMGLHATILYCVWGGMERCDPTWRTWLSHPVFVSAELQPATQNKLCLSWGDRSCSSGLKCSFSILHQFHFIRQMLLHDHPGVMFRGVCKRREEKLARCGSTLVSFFF